jgi:4-hydroxybenzoyl-CoA thioesterase
MTSLAPFESAKLIRFHHCDPAGIVLSAILRVMNELVEDWFNDGLGVDFAASTPRAARHPMAHLGATFSRRARSADAPVRPLRAEDRRRLLARRRGRAGDECGSGRRSSSCTPRSARRAVPFSPEFREKLARFVR